MELNRRDLLKLGIASIAFYGLNVLMKDDFHGFFSRKGKVFATGVDYCAYNEDVSFKIKNEELKLNLGLFVGVSEYSMINWFNNLFANTLGFMPFYPIIGTKDSEASKNPQAYIINRGTQLIDSICGNKDLRDNHKNVVVKVNNHEYYRQFKYVSDPVDMLVVLAVRKSLKYKTMILELEAEDGSKGLAKLNGLMSTSKKISPLLPIAINLKKEQAHNGKHWDPQKSREYWVDADKIILDDAFSSAKELKESIQRFKDATSKDIWCRIYTGHKRMEHGFPGDYHDLEELVVMANNTAEGCLVNDGNGAWLSDGGKNNPYDNGIRANTLSSLYFRIRNYRFIQEVSYSGYPG